MQASQIQKIAWSLFSIRFHIWQINQGKIEKKVDFIKFLIYNYQL